VRTLGLDASSTHIGWVLLEDGVGRWRGVITLKDKSIAKRCLVARRAVAQLIESWKPDRVGIESPVGRFAGAVIPQARVSGAVLSVIEEANLPWHDIAPKEAKKALASSGTADKEKMLRAAAPYLGYSDTELTFKAKRKDLWVALDGEGAVVYDEHTADAVAIALVASSHVG
jgi:Holliday junction resolvasome RuvABC endonuclease subunit